MTDLGTPPGRQTVAVAINNRGQIIGDSATSTGVWTHGSLWENGRMTVLNFRPVAINTSGQIIGTGSSSSHAVLWQNGKITDLGTLRGDAQSSAVAINDRGQIVGTSAVHGFLWQKGKLTDLGTLRGDTSSAADAINERGQIVGSSSSGGGVTAIEHAVVWQNGRITDLGSLGGRQSQAVAINARGQIVGWSKTKAGVMHAVLWTQQPRPRSGCPKVSAPLAPGETVVVRRNAITVGGPITELKADTGRAIVLVEPRGLDPALGPNCADVFVWKRATGRIVTVFDHRTCHGADLQSYFGIALAGDNAAWIESDGGNVYETDLFVKSLTTGRSRQVDWAAAGGQGYSGSYIVNAHGAGNVLVYNRFERCQPRQYSPDVPCPPGYTQFDYLRSDRGRASEATTDRHRRG